MCSCLAGQLPSGRFAKQYSPRQIFLLVVEEEKDFILPDGAADIPGVVVNVKRWLLDAGCVIRESIRVQKAVLMLPKRAPMELIRAALRYETMVTAPSEPHPPSVHLWRQSLRPRRRSDWRGREEPCRRCAVTREVVVHSIDGDIDRSVGHRVIRREPFVTAALRSRNQLGERQRIASSKGKILDRVSAYGRSERVARCLETSWPLRPPPFRGMPTLLDFLVRRSPRIHYNVCYILLGANPLASALNVYVPGCRAGKT